MEDSPEILIPDPVHAEIRVAINIKTALDRIYRLPHLGYCPTKVQEFRKQFRPEIVEDSPEGRFETRDLANQVCKCRL
jgi:hypothetical protein